ncbi:uncharacterized protein F5Z01DRAFT_463624 [Emericellopsis atlantica]|uniref:Uncharacterized protein n=1 Tax=Emericellopsis atlantica TaxID=2614577 RepID=A0A9P8CU21_9HYPO|nr:uncharacterized protein F5Z01DRAFT_463624 [Emericellopsis atlantica]KAG9257296.1 hypothetical protein F5Z01DRAFT_463624 [Emericellopsis atlantica]
MFGVALTLTLILSFTFAFTYDPLNHHSSAKRSAIPTQNIHHSNFCSQKAPYHSQTSVANSTNLHDMEALVRWAYGALRTLLEIIVNNPTTAVALDVLSFFLSSLVYTPILRMIGFGTGGYGDLILNLLVRVWLSSAGSSRIFGTTQLRRSILVNRLDHGNGSLWNTSWAPR